MRAHHASPELVIPHGFDYVVNWFWELRSFCDDREKPITPLIVNEWIECLGVLLSDWEKLTLFAMDRIFRHTLSEEISYNEDRRQKSEAGKNKR